MQQLCKGCGQQCLFISKPVFDGFTKVGEVETCTACGHSQSPLASDKPEPANKTPAKNEAFDRIFADVEPERIRIEGQDDEVRFCRHCKNYLINAWNQRCGISLEEVSATDTCDKFERADPDDDTRDESSPL